MKVARLRTPSFGVAVPKNLSPSAACGAEAGIFSRFIRQLKDTYTVTVNLTLKRVLHAETKSHWHSRDSRWRGRCREDAGFARRTRGARGSCWPRKKLADSIRGKDVLHFADNKAANASAAKGYSGAADLARIVSALHGRWAELGIDPWVEFVKSEANIADEPSRGFLDTLIAMSGVEVPFDYPPIKVWS